MDLAAPEQTHFEYNGTCWVVNNKINHSNHTTNKCTNYLSQNAEALQNVRLNLYIKTLKQKPQFEIYARLDNAATRNWYRKVNNIPKVDPSVINWNKVEDTTELYGPSFSSNISTFSNETKNLNNSPKRRSRSKSVQFNNEISLAKISNDGRKTIHLPTKMTNNSNYNPNWEIINNKSLPPYCYCGNTNCNCIETDVYLNNISSRTNKKCLEPINENCENLGFVSWISSLMNI